MRRAKGTGSIKKIGTKFHARWTIQGRDVYGPARSTRDEAEKDRLAGPPKSVEHKDLTVLQFGRMILDAENPNFGYYAKGLADSSFNTNVIHLECHIAGTRLGAMKVRDVTAPDIQIWLANLKSVKRKKVGDFWVQEKVEAKPATKSRNLGFLIKLFNLAVDHDLINKNPCKGVKQPKLIARSNTLLTSDQLRILYQQRCRTGRLLIFAVETGLRRGELLNLKWSDIDGDSMKVTNFKNHQQVDVLPISEKAVSVLASLPRLGEWVFCTNDGKPLSKRNLNRDVRNLFNRLGFPPETRLHDLRGRFLNDLISSGVDIKTTQALARHANPNTTMKHYLRASDEAKRNALKRMTDSRTVANNGSDK
jgi:integrase